MAINAIDPEARVDRPDRSGDGFLQRNALAVACFVIFAVFLFAQSLTGWGTPRAQARQPGWRTAVAEAVQHGESSFTYWKYLTTGHFAEATLENWESEFLQMGAFVLLTVFLVQKGSGEPKKSSADEDIRSRRHDPDARWPVRRGGAWLKLYENSLFLAFLL